MPYYYSFLDLLPYFLLGVILIFSLISTNLSEKQKSFLIYYTFLVFTILRYDVGWDYFQYQDQIKTGDTQRFEFLSRLIMDIGHWLNFYPLVFAIFGFIILYFNKLTIDKYSSNVSLSWIAFFCIPFLFSASLSTIRQAAAVSLIFYSFHFATGKKPFRFALAIFVSFLFHSSGIVGILIYPLVYFNVKKVWLGALFIISFIISQFSKSFLLPYIADSNFDERIFYYVNNSESAQQSTSMQYLFYLFSIFNLFFYDRLVKTNPINAKFISISIIGICLYNILGFEPNSALRIGGMFMSFWILIIPSYSKIFSFKSPKLVNFVISLFLFGVLAILIDSHISAYLNGTLEKISFIPYDFWFLHLND